MTNKKSVSLDMTATHIPYLDPLSSVSPVGSPIFQHPHRNMSIHADTYRREPMNIQSIIPDFTIDDQDVLIGVMGATGSGKSTFINTVSGSNLRVGRGLMSCTETVQPAKPFELDGRLVTLIDTPGFDDTSKSDADVLNMIAAFLAATYEQGIKLSGLIYFHRITDNRMGGISTRNLRMFRELCGDSSLKNVVVVTNMWELLDHHVGEEREAELATRDSFFRPVLQRGAQLARHHNTKDSGFDILRRIINNTPMSLRIQRELIDEKIDITKTAAGAELNRALLQQIMKHRAEIKQIQYEMREAIKQKDEETRRDLEQETTRLQTEMQKMHDDSKKLAFHYSQERVRLEMRLQEVASEARREAVELSANYQKQIAALQDKLQMSVSTSEYEKQEILRKLNEIQMSRRSHAKEGIFVMIGRALDVMLGY